MFVFMLIIHVNLKAIFSCLLIEKLVIIDIKPQFNEIEHKFKRVVTTFLAIEETQNK